MEAIATADIAASARHHPWLIASLVVHAMLAAGLYAAGPMRIDERERQAVHVQVDASLREGAQRAMQRELRRMEEIRDALEESAGLPARAPAADDTQDAADPARRAQQIAQQIEEVRQQLRAAEMARVLHIPEPEARRRVQAEAASRPMPAASRTSAKPNAQEAAVQQASEQARAALDERRKQLQAQHQGVGVTPGSAQDGAKDGKAPGGAQQGPAAGGGQSGRIDALAAGMEVGSPEVITGRSLDMSSMGSANGRGFGSYVAPPYVDAARLVPGRGNVIGAGGPAANRVFLNTWWVIGPFEGEGGASQQAVYPPERGVDLDAVYYGKDGQPVHWAWQQQTDYPMVPRGHAEDAVYYAYTEVSVGRDMDLWVWIGADDDSKMWFNDSAVWISVQTGNKSWYHQAYTSLGADISTMNLTEGQRRLHFRKGRNTILFKLYNNLGLMFFSVVLSAG